MSQAQPPIGEQIATLELQQRLKSCKKQQEKHRKLWEVIRKLKVVGGCSIAEYKTNHRQLGWAWGKNEETWENTQIDKLTEHFW